MDDCSIEYFHSRKDLSLKNAKVDILLITGMLSPYATVVEKLFSMVDKDKVTMLKIERAGDVLADTVCRKGLSTVKFGGALKTITLKPLKIFLS